VERLVVSPSASIGKPLDSQKARFAIWYHCEMRFLSEGVRKPLNLPQVDTDKHGFGLMNSGNAIFISPSVFICVYRP